jgi:ankyrin repeat protein
MQNEKGKLPLYMAVAHGYVEKFYERLLKTGADPNIPNNHGATPIFVVTIQISISFHNMATILIIKMIRVILCAS